MRRFALVLLLLSLATLAFGNDFCRSIGASIYDQPTPTDGGIREDIPSKYRAKYDSWKAELLSTEYGRSQWLRFAENRSFVLKIEVSGKREKGAGTGDFEFNDAGELVGATVTLGGEIDRGYPNSYYYPVLESLAVTNDVVPYNGRLLAVTKFSHELGHVDQILLESVELLRLQDKLIPQYSNIFLKNGWNTNDKKLVELADKMGGTPTEIWEHREYKSEKIALQFLSQKIATEPFRCDVLRRIKRNVVGNARQYQRLFESLPVLSDAGCFSNS